MVSSYMTFSEERKAEKNSFATAAFEGSVNHLLKSKKKLRFKVVSRRRSGS